jgi:ribulose-5-phosphate 4-epimerase/fuculose-1-phosphate aldolase
MKNIPDEYVTGFVEACRAAADHGLMRCSSGNMSRRVDQKHMLATRSRSWMSTFSPGDVVLCCIDDGSVIDGQKPTVEINIHAGILRTRPDIDVVMHFQTPHATALACSDLGDINYFVIPEIPFYIGPIGRVPYIPPGTKELGQAVTEAMRDHDLVQMGHHGQVTVGRDFDQAIQNAEFFELACEVILRGGSAVTPLSEDSAQELLSLGGKGSGQGT